MFVTGYAVHSAQYAHSSMAVADFVQTEWTHTHTRTEHNKHSHMKYAHIRVKVGSREGLQYRNSTTSNTVFRYIFFPLDAH